MNWNPKERATLLELILEVDYMERNIKESPQLIEVLSFEDSLEKPISYVNKFSLQSSAEKGSIDT